MLAFHLQCVPPTVTAQTKRLRWTPTGPRFYQSARMQREVRTWTTLLGPYVPAAPLDGPLVLELMFVWPHGSRVRQKDRERLVPKITRPDASNVAKHFEDLLVTLRFIEDDARVARLVVEKFTGPAPQVGIAVQISPCRGELG